MPILFTFISFSQPNTEVFLFDLNAKNDGFELSNFKNISNNEGYDNQPSFWGNNTILYAGTRNEQTDIVKYNIEDSSKKWLSDTEGSEYSPTRIPFQDTFSAIRLDSDGKQLLYRYDLKNETNNPIINDLVIGYHSWIDQNTLVASVLEGNMMSVYLIDLVSGKRQMIDDNVGRSLHKTPYTILKSIDIIPVPNHFIYISKKSTPWKIMFYDLNQGSSKKLTELLPAVEDVTYINSNILIGKGNKLYLHQAGKTLIWKEIASLEDYGITNITRLAVSPDGTKLAVVGELSSQTLEPKLENIKWIAGNWKGEAFGGLTEENWSEPSGGSMMATFKLIDKGAVVFYEIEIIREINNTLILQLKHFDNDLKGWETKDETVDFPLKEITPDKVVFEGMTFEKVSDNEMNVYVDIDQENGEIETIQFNYKK